MADQPTAYVAGLATELVCRHPALLTAENDLAILRGRLALVATFIHNPHYDHTARTALATALNLPAPTR